MADLKYSIEFDTETSDIRLAESDINKLDDTLDSAAKSFKNTESSADKTNKGIKALGGGFNMIKTAIAGYLGLNLVQNLADTADAYTTLASRIKVAVGETGNVKEAMAGVQQVALATNANLDATAQLFAKVNDVGRQMGMTQQQSLDLVKTINQAIAVGGGNAQSAEAAITQLTQSLQSGVLRGDEFNSIMEQAPGISQALADSLGVTTGELRAMAGEGKLSSQTVIKALTDQADVIQDKYEQFPKTISQALQNISTQWQIVVGEFNSESGASAVVVNALQVIGDNLGRLKHLFDDIGNGVSWVSEQFRQIDASTIDTLKGTLSQAYDTVKDLAKSIGEMGVTAWEAFKSTLDSVSPFFNAITSGQKEVSGLQSVMHGLQLTMGILSDGAKGLSIILNGLVAGLQFVAGGLSALQAKVAGFMGFDDVAKQAEMASDKLFEAGKKSLERANNQIMDFKSSASQALDDMQKTEEQKNAESVANAKAKMDELFALNKQEVDAKKVSEEEKLTAVKAYAEQAIKANDGVISDQLRLDLATRNYIATVDEAGKVTVEAWNSVAKSTDAVNQSLKDTALNAAKGLGVDVREALNQLDPAFERNAQSVKQVADGYNELKQEGLDASRLITVSLEKLLEGAKSQKEIDVVRQLYVQFGKDGKLSAEQVQAGIDGINQNLEKTPHLLDETTKALKALGIISKEEAKRQAQEQIQNFELAKQAFDKGLISAEQLQQAIGKVQKSVQVSGDASQQAWLKSQQTAMGLTQKVDETTASTQRLAQSASNIGQGMASGVSRSISELDKLNAKLSETVTWNEKVAASASADKTKRDANNNQFLAAQARQSGQYSTLTGMEGFLKSAGLSQERALAEAQKLMEQYGKNGRMNWGKANGASGSPHAGIIDLARFKSPSVHLLELAEKIKVADARKKRRDDFLGNGKEKTAGDTVSKVLAQPPNTNHIAPTKLNIGISAKDVADVWDKRMTELVEKGLKDFMKQLRDEANRLAK